MAAMTDEQRWLFDLQGFIVWCASYLGNEVIWRGQRYRLVSGGKMQRVAD